MRQRAYLDARAQGLAEESEATAASLPGASDHDDRIPAPVVLPDASAWHEDYKACREAHGLAGRRGCLRTVCGS